MHPIIQRLKERQLVQGALAYAAGAWGLRMVGAAEVFRREALGILATATA